MFLVKMILPDVPCAFNCIDPLSLNNPIPCYRDPDYPVLLKQKLEVLYKFNTQRRSREKGEGGGGGLSSPFEQVVVALLESSRVFFIRVF